MGDNQRDGSGYEGTDEYVPNGADAYEIKKDAPRVAWQGSGGTSIHINQWAPESKSFTATATRPGQLVLKLFNYPAWKVQVNGIPVEAGTLEVTGQMTVPVEAGENLVRVVFARTRDRLVGGFISLGAAILLFGAMFFSRRIPMLAGSD